MNKLVLVTAFGPGGENGWKRFFEAIGAQSRKPDCAIFIDTTGNNSCLGWAQDLSSGSNFPHKWLTVPPASLHSARDISRFLASLWNVALQYVDDADWILSLEHDVILPGSNAIATLAEATGDNSVGIVGTPVISRHGGHLMVYHCQSTDPWSIDRRRRVVPCPNGITQVDSVSLSCTLIRASVVRFPFAFSATPDANGGGGNGHEWSLMKHCALSGSRILCDFRVRPEHLCTDGSSRVYSRG